MKRNLFTPLVLIFALFFSFEASSWPIYIGFRLGFGAEWQIVEGNCDPGRGVCISLGNPSISDNAELGFDEINKSVFLLRVPKSGEISSHFKNKNFDILADSPVDPSLIKKFPTFRNVTNQFVIIKKGAYPIKIEKDYYLIELNNYLK